MSIWQKLFSASAPVSSATETTNATFYQAVQDGDLRRVKALLKRSPALVHREYRESYTESWTPLHKAAVCGPHGCCASPTGMRCQG